LSKNEVVNKHARRNALIPAITISGLMIAGLLTGVTITETVFDMGGIGQYAAQSARLLDIPPVIGYALLSAVLFVVSNLIVDVLYAYIDPRIRLG
jgi:peptide/nickel transport system permease protein